MQNPEERCLLLPERLDRKSSSVSINMPWINNNDGCDTASYKVLALCPGCQRWQEQLTSDEPRSRREV